MGKFKDKSKNIPQYLGSVFSKTGDAIVPPTGCVFVAITTLAATTFSNTTGLVAESATQWANTEDAAGDLAASSESVNEGSGGEEVVVGDSFPAGITIYGRYTKINIASGKIIAYYTGGTQNTTLLSAETTTHANKAAAPGGPAV